MTRVKGKAVFKTIKVIEHFASNSQTASVMELVRKLDIPQSTMSETLNVLVDMGILARDLPSRTYSATPRLAALGLASQPKYIASGMLFKLMEDCAAELGTAIGLYGICNQNSQLYQLVNGPNYSANEPGGFCALLGAQTPLQSSAIGYVLMASLGADHYEKLLWRLKAEAKQGETFIYSALCAEVKKAEVAGWAIGDSGLGHKWRATATLLPPTVGKHPLAIAALYQDTRLEYAQSVADMLRSKINEVLPIGEK